MNTHGDVLLTQLLIILNATGYAFNDFWSFMGFGVCKVWALHQATCVCLYCLDTLWENLPLGPIGWYAQKLELHSKHIIIPHKKAELLSFWYVQPSHPLLSTCMPWNLVLLQSWKGILSKYMYELMRSGMVEKSTSYNFILQQTNDALISLCNCLTIKTRHKHLYKNSFCHKSTPKNKCKNEFYMEFWHWRHANLIFIKYYLIHGCHFRALKKSARSGY